MSSEDENAVVAAFGWFTRHVDVAIATMVLTIVPMIAPGSFESAEAATRETFGSPPKMRPPAPTTVQRVQNVPTPRRLADLYTQVGRALAEASKRDPNSTIDLWPRYRWVNFMDAIKTPAKRIAAAAILEKLLVETKKLKP